ncbi:hypothetical protein OAP14_11480 [Aliiglaciecola sp.]|nr:hypothetical protein [Aliiglaciecola sp.]
MSFPGQFGYRVCNIRGIHDGSMQKIQEAGDIIALINNRTNEMVDLVRKISE